MTKGILELEPRPDKDLTEQLSSFNPLAQAFAYFAFILDSLRLVALQLGLLQRVRWGRARRG